MFSFLYAGNFHQNHRDSEKLENDGVAPGSVTNQLHSWVGNILVVCKMKTLTLLDVVITRINLESKGPDS